MPQPHEEIRHLNENSHGKIVTEELRTTWLRERWRYEEETLGQRKSTATDYDNFKFKPEYQGWKTEAENLIETRDRRWEAERISLPELRAFDKEKEQHASFEEKDHEAKKTYVDLLDHFADEKISPYVSAKWDLPNDSTTTVQWKKLLLITGGEVQRNATDLASVVANNRSVASGEVKRGTGGSEPEVKKWQNSELYHALESLEQALARWDQELSPTALR
jgi:hypothetical protein